MSIRLNLQNTKTKENVEFYLTERTIEKLNEALKTQFNFTSLDDIKILLTPDSILSTDFLITSFFIHHSINNVSDITESLLFELHYLVNASERSLKAAYIYFILFHNKYNASFFYFPDSYLCYNNPLYGLKYLYIIKCFTEKLDGIKKLTQKKAKELLLSEFPVFEIQNYYFYFSEVYKNSID